LHTIIIIIIIIIITTTATAIVFSLCVSSPYTSTEKINKNKIYIKETMQKQSTKNSKHSKCGTRINTTSTRFS